MGVVENFRCDVSAVTLQVEMAVTVTMERVIGFGAMHKATMVAVVTVVVCQ